METPLIVTLARQISVQDQMDVIANNIANMSTTAYKGERVMFKDYLDQTGHSQPVIFPQQAGLHRVETMGPIEQTSNPLDVALKGDGYFAVQTPTGVRYTRNGHFTLDNQGQLVTSEGYQVLDSSGQPFVFGTGIKKITISKDGTVSADDNQLGKLKVVSFANPQALQRQGSSLFTTSEVPQPAKKYDVLQGHLEGSNVQPILEITRFMRATQFYQASKKIIDAEHNRQKHAIDLLGTLPGQ